MKEYENSYQYNDNDFNMNNLIRFPQGNNNIMPYNNNQEDDYPRDNINKRNNLIQDDNDNNDIESMGDINVNHYQYAQDLNKNINGEQDGQLIKEQQEINYNIFKGFLTKVYGILSFQFLLTLIIILIFQVNSIKNYFLERTGFTSFLSLLCLIGLIGTLVLLAIKENLAKKVPYNYISLLIITLCISFSCAFLSLSYDSESVILCVVLTAISACVITAYSYYSKSDLSTIKALIMVVFGQCGGFFFILLLFGGTILEKVIYFVATLMFGVYLVYDTQIIMKKFGEVYTVDDYIFASIQIYLDMANLFMMILSVIGNRNNKR